MSRALVCSVFSVTTASKRRSVVTARAVEVESIIEPRRAIRPVVVTEPVGRPHIVAEAGEGKGFVRAIFLIIAGLAAFGMLTVLMQMPGEKPVSFRAVQSDRGAPARLG